MGLLVCLSLIVERTGGVLAQEFTSQENIPATAGEEEIPPSDAILPTAKSIFVEPMSQGFDKFLVSELKRAKNLYAVTPDRREADLWMKGIVIAVETGPTATRPHDDSNLAHSQHAVTATATIVVVARGRRAVLWEGEARLQFMPGTHIPEMARALVAQLQKAVKEARKPAKTRHGARELAPQLDPRCYSAYGFEHRKSGSTISQCREACPGDARENPCG